MSSPLRDVGQRLQQFAAGIVSRTPGRDALAAERDALLLAPPPAPESLFPPPDLPSCRCHDCLRRAQEDQDRRITHAAWTGRVGAIERQLFRLTWGDSDEHDDLGRELSELAADLVRAGETNRARGWERVIETDPRGREVRAWTTWGAIGEVGAELLALHRRIDGMTYLGAADLRQALTATREAMVSALARPLRRPLPVEVAKAAGLTTPPPNEAERLGLAPGPSPSILEGNVRFSRRGRA
jgi:hypothetical protein